MPEPSPLVSPVVRPAAFGTHCTRCNRTIRKGHKLVYDKMFGLPGAPGAVVLCLACYKPLTKKVSPMPIVFPKISEITLLDDDSPSEADEFGPERVRMRRNDTEW